jgi:hypothetical protein
MVREWFFINGKSLLDSCSSGLSVHVRALVGSGLVLPFEKQLIVPKPSYYILTLKLTKTNEI